MKNKGYHNKGFIYALLFIIFAMLPLPFIINWLTWGDEFMKPFMSMNFPDRCIYEDNKHNKVNRCTE